MPHLLVLESSAARPENSASRRLSAAFVDAWRERGEAFTVTERDLHADPLPHLPDSGLHWLPEDRIEGEAPAAAAQSLQRDLLEEFAAADALLVGAPLYNWSLPSSLKAWIDHVHVVGATVPPESAPYSRAGIPAVVVSPRGLEYGAGTELEGRDYAVPALQQVLGAAMGLDVHAVTVDLTLAGRLAELDDRVADARSREAQAEAELRSLAQGLLG